jgi:hypothetical protein
MAVAAVEVLTVEANQAEQVELVEAVRVLTQPQELLGTLTKAAAVVAVVMTEQCVQVEQEVLAWLSFAI